MTTHRVQLDTVKKWRNTHEWRPVTRATCNGIEVTTEGFVMPAICRALSDAGYTGMVEAYRGDNPALKAREIGDWISGKALATREQPEHLRRGEQ